MCQLTPKSGDFGTPVTHSSGALRWRRRRARTPFFAGLRDQLGPTDEVQRQRGGIIGGKGSWKNGMFDRPSATQAEAQADKKI